MPHMETPCWVWIGGTLGGYGRTRILGSKILAHRISVALHCGQISDSVCALHRCDNPPCVNPQHIFTGTRADNNTDKARKLRAPSALNGNHPESLRTRCPQGHEYTPENTLIEKKGNGFGRKCRLCNLQRMNSYYARNREAVLAKIHAKRTLLRDSTGYRVHYDKANPRLIIHIQPAIL